MCIRDRYPYTAAAIVMTLMIVIVVLVRTAVRASRALMRRTSS